MGKIIFIGRTGSGKTTLCQKLHELTISYKKTQSVEWYDYAIDTPGEYLENRHYYSALLTTATDAKLIAVLADPTAEENFIPPAFTGSFAKEVIGIITKVSLVEEARKIDLVEDSLKSAGISKIFKVDTISNVGVDELFEYIKSVLDRNEV